MQSTWFVFLCLLIFTFYSLLTVKAEALIEVKIIFNMWHFIYKLSSSACFCFMSLTFLENISLVLAVGHNSHRPAQNNSFAAKG